MSLCEGRKHAFPLLTFYEKRCVIATPHRLQATGPKGEISEEQGVGIMIARGMTVPVDTTPGYAPGCIFIMIDPQTAGAAYVNVGDRDSCTFEKITTS